MANFPETRISLILRLAQVSDVLAWREFADIYAPAIHGLAIRKGLQTADADDLTQEVLFGVARAIERFQPDASRAQFRTWLSRIARNLIADHFAGRAKQPVSQAISDSWLERVGGERLTEKSGLPAEFENEYRTAIFRLAAARVRQRVAEATWLAFERTSVAREQAESVAREIGMSLGGLYVARCRVLKLLRTEVQTIERSYSGEVDPYTEAKQ